MRPVHLENGQIIQFKENDDPTTILNKNDKTQLTEYITLNSENDFARTLLYHDIPKYFVWNNQTKMYKLKVKPNYDIVGRMYFVHPSNIELFVKVAFAMTINKAQGQTLEFAGIWLDKPVYTHGQLYVALSRVGNPKSVKIFKRPGSGNFTRNVVSSFT